MYDILGDLIIIVIIYTRSIIRVISASDIRQIDRSIDKRTIRLYTSRARSRGTWKDGTPRYLRGRGTGPPTGNSTFFPAGYRAGRSTGSEHERDRFASISIENDPYREGRYNGSDICDDSPALSLMAATRKKKTQRRCCRYTGENCKFRFIPIYRHVLVPRSPLYPLIHAYPLFTFHISDSYFYSGRVFCNKLFSSFGIGNSRALW